MACMKFLLSHCMPCWLPRRSFPRSLREWYKFLTFFEESSFFFSLFSFGHDECSDYNLAEEFSTKNWKIFAQCTQLVKKTYFLKKNGLHNDPIVSVNVVLTTSPKLPLQFPWRIKSLYFFRKFFFIFPQYVPMDTKNALITTLLTRFRRKAARNVSLKVNRR